MCVLIHLPQKQPFYDYKVRIEYAATLMKSLELPHIDEVIGETMLVKFRSFFTECAEAVSTFPSP